MPNDKRKSGKLALRFHTLHAYNDAEAVITADYLESIGYESKKDAS